jgi:hypothetical protein
MEAEVETPEVQEAPPTEQPTGPGTQPPPSKAEMLYNKLLKEGYTEQNLGKKDDFIKRVQNPLEANKLYSVLRNDGYTEENLGDMITFRNNLVTVKKKDSTDGSQQSTGGSDRSPATKTDFSKLFDPKVMQQIKDIQKKHLQDLNDPSSQYYKDIAKKREDYEKAHPGSWSNTIGHISNALTQTISKPLSGLAKVERDIIGAFPKKEGDKSATDASAPLYDEQGNLTAYGHAVDIGKIHDPLGRFAIALDASNKAEDEQNYNNPLPHTFLGNTATGVINLAPDIGVTMLFPEEKVVEEASALSRLKSAIVNPFTKYMTAKGGIDAYSEA